MYQQLNSFSNKAQEAGDGWTVDCHLTERSGRAECKCAVEDCAEDTN